MIVPCREKEKENTHDLDLRVDAKKPVGPSKSLSPLSSRDLMLASSSLSDADNARILAFSLMAAIVFAACAHVPGVDGELRWSLGELRGVIGVCNACSALSAREDEDEGL